MMNRLTIDDLLNGGSSEKFEIAPDRGKLRVIKKKLTTRKPEIYKNESELKKAANDLLEKLPRCKLLKTDNGARFVKGGRRAKSRTPGMGDQHLCIYGLFVSIEAKMPGEKLKPDQVTYRDEVVAAGGIYIEYHSLYELVEEMKKHRLLDRRFKI